MEDPIPVPAGEVQRHFALWQDRALTRPVAVTSRGRCRVLAYAGSELPTMDGPEAGAVEDATLTWPGGYIASLITRELPGGRPGRRQVWRKTHPTLIEGEEVGALAELVTRCDTANGIAVRIDPKKLMYPNVELSLHLVRAPRRGWVGLDTAVTFGPTGLGLTSSTIHDEDGPVGRVEQALTVREFPA